ncbi:hypothetical protein C2E23DRAFT_571504 [Lenzites betulinus]|nr:hypothetical protein C2E23DRAFT_571504 [Lenzites betulinus]
MGTPWCRKFYVPRLCLGGCVVMFCAVYTRFLLGECFWPTAASDRVHDNEHLHIHVQHSSDGARLSRRVPSTSARQPPARRPCRCACMRSFIVV